jgi:hemerythrin-like metal-binding protein
LIDLQHQQLFRIINELHTAMQAGHPEEVLAEILEGLVLYTKTHFRTEEDYFAEYNYPEREGHEEEHARFINKINEFRNTSRAGGVSVSVELLQFLSQWIRHHIKTVDRAYIAFFREKGIF